VTAVTYSHLRRNLAKVMDEAVRGRAPITVTRQGSSAVVLISAEEFAAMEETIHLLRSPRNAERLMRSIADANAGRASEQKRRRSEPRNIPTSTDPR
jgi:antitoxin YefM